jgi:hypothetical protein
LTQEILQAPIGSLFGYKIKSRSSRSSSSSSYTTEEHRELAWQEADPVCQKVEFLLRGHAATIPGSIWQRALSTTTGDNASSNSSNSNINNNSSSSSLAVMQSLVDRLWQEGHAYMRIRADKLQEEQELLMSRGNELEDVNVDLLLKSASSISSSSSSSPLLAAGGVGEDVDVEEEDGAEFEDYIEMEDLQDVDGNNDDETGAEGDEDDDDPFMNDFAMPGPTVQMYDTLLDAMACSQEQGMLQLQPQRLPKNEDDDDDKSFYGSPTHARYLMDCITSRHNLDTISPPGSTKTTARNKQRAAAGSGYTTLNPYTTPTILSFNAPIRLAANLGRGGGGINGQQQFLAKHKDLRDNALMLAFLAYDQATHSNIVQCNSATYTYLLQVVARYWKNASLEQGNRNKGNIAICLWDSAVENGLINDHVLQAFLETQTPSNGPAYETWMMTQMQQHQERVVAAAAAAATASGSSSLRNVGTAKFLPHKWRRYSRVQRHDERDDIY